MVLSQEELRVTAMLLVAAFGAMTLGAFLPAYNARRLAAVTVREQRSVGRVVEALWVGTQGAILAAIVGGAFAQGLLRGMPTSLLAYSSLPFAGAGAAVFFLGCGLAAWGANHLAEELTVEIQTREGGNLVTTGPYARIRHPIYTGILFMVGGAAMVTASPLLGGYLAVAAYCAVVRARTEEDLLASDPVHGQAYRSYVKRTGRFIPPVGPRGR